jgi:argininosuccinate lyase
VLALIGTHLSRLGEDLVFWASQECGLLEMDDAVATGSSLMPQKKNPDVPELVRGQAGLVLGDLVALFTVLKGLPLSYNRDLQWDKRCVAHAVYASRMALGVMTRFLRHVRIRAARAGQLLASSASSATDLAEHLVERGVPFAEAHAIVGRLVVLAERAGVPLARLTIGQLRSVSPRFGREALKLLDPRHSVTRKRSAGSTNPRHVREAIAKWKKQLSR